MDDINLDLDRAYDLAVKGDYEGALIICDRVISENPSLPDGFRKRAAVWARMEDLAHAVEDINRAIEIDPTQPDFFFARGCWQMGLGNFPDSIRDQSKAIELGAENNFHYYDESSYFFRAAALLRSGRFDEALSDCEHVREDFQVYSIGIGKLTKADLVRQAKQSRAENDA